jgi:hypothetical protein
MIEVSDLWQGFSKCGLWSKRGVASFSILNKLKKSMRNIIIMAVYFPTNTSNSASIDVRCQLHLIDAVAGIGKNVYLEHHIYVYGIQNLIYTESDFIFCTCVWVQSRDACAFYMHCIRVQILICT